MTHNGGLSMDDRQAAAVLAGLRLLQAEMANNGGGRLGKIWDVYTIGDTIEGLGDAEIDALCERINCTPRASPGPFAIVIEGGNVIAVVARDPRVIGRPYVTIDYDLEGLGARDVVHMVPQGEGARAPAYVRTHAVESTDAFDPAESAHWQAVAAADLD